MEPNLETTKEKLDNLVSKVEGIKPISTKKETFYISGNSLINYFLFTYAIWKCVGQPLVTMLTN